MDQRAPVTESLARFIADFTADALPDPVMRTAEVLAFDGVGVLLAATHPSVTANSGIGAYVMESAGPGGATLIGRARKVDPASAALANGTLGYAADFEPHHPEAILHPVAVMIPVALALAETENRSGADILAAIALGCEVTYRVSMAMNPRTLYARGFHPSAVAGSFGAAAAAAFLSGLDAKQTRCALGLAALQTGGLLAWQDDPREDARPFQMGLAARNGVMSARLARHGFGAPDRIFDGGHTALAAFSDTPDPAPLVDGLGTAWDGVTELAIKPYPCVSFLHPALDAQTKLLAEYKLSSRNISSIALRFAEAGAHCVDNNPLKGHSAQYILPVHAARGGLSYLDLFTDRRESDPEVARLAASARVIRDTGEFDDRFPDFYVGEVTLTLTDGTILTARNDVARGYPENPLGRDEIEAKFAKVTGEVATAERARALAKAVKGLRRAPDTRMLASLLAPPPDAAPGDQASRSPS
ncbi:MmgE/PrpD family protein [Acuticoccus sp. MNP-M23]|uniref:MmgE/PrpD family protein n=1 Tax=Acuticoccus sp. MNP-M23 TaxID=3072793 RepID=UPI002814D0FC|nr:MmgE/PrpD family protein [Acuticoccus sp. MNP-M23]WMS41992.1 MmgE/PrpD family protein [Acuticoccus sp. MNP-M23]